VQDLKNIINDITVTNTAPVAFFEPLFPMEDISSFASTSSACTAKSAISSTRINSKEHNDEFVLDEEEGGDDGVSDIRSLLMGGYSIEQAMDILRWEGGSGGSLSTAVTPTQTSITSSNCDVSTPEQKWSQPVADADQKSFVRGNNACYV
jgi:hypothetical protein